jgi:hypothetical protein
MCQAYEAERNYIVAGEREQRKKGYEAQKRGEPRTANPNYSHSMDGKYFAHDYDYNAWHNGWGTAAAGRELW